jgi:CRISPR-associated protein Cmr4
MKREEKTNMKNNTAIIGLHARTSIAAGTGQNLGAIDLPIMREAPTDYPVIYGSALKGALRAKFEEELGKEKAEAVKVYFGDDSAGGSQYAGALIVSDAKILLLPIRSLTTHFRWVTCPYILERAARDLELLGEKAEWNIPEPAKDEALTIKENGTIYLEEFAFTTKKASLDAMIGWIATLMDGVTEETLRERLVIVHDDMFAHLSRFATPVNAHIAIDNATKTVKNGALWYEETLPPETLLYSLLIANASRKEGDGEAQAQIIKSHVVGHLEKNPYLQVGGNETVGMGWCKVVCHG